MNGIQESQKLESVHAVNPLIGTEKRCLNCGKIKTLSEFPTHPTMSGGYRNQCKVCVRERYKRWKEKNDDRIKEYGRKQYKFNKDKRKQYYKKWKEENLEKTKEYGRKYRTEHPGLSRQWNLENPKRRREINRKARKKKILTPKDIINYRMKVAIRKSLGGNKKNRKWESLVGYTARELKKHLEGQFIDGMTWDRLMMGEIHIDHKIPKSVFNFSTPEDIDFKRCWALENLQPMWAIENMLKSDKLDMDFQPEFAFGS